MSPSPSSSRPQVSVGTMDTWVSTRAATMSSSLRRRGLSTAQDTSGIRPPGQHRTS